jgi:8-oxo-dGTP diphosphatase
MPKIKCTDLNNNIVLVDKSELTFRPSIYGILIEDGKILLSPQWDGYDLPGGGMEPFETFEEALVREFQEETGLIIQVKDYIDHLQSFFLLPIQNKPVNSLLFVYAVEKVSGELSTKYLDEDEKIYAKKAKWVDINKIGNMRFYNEFDNKKLIAKALSLIKS